MMAISERHRPCEAVYECFHLAGRILCRVGSSLCKVKAPKQHRGDSPLGTESVTTPSITFKWTTLVVALLNSVTSEILHQNPAEAPAS